MKIRILKREKNTLRLEIEGEGHTFCNLLQKMLLRDTTIKLAGYNVSHPLVSNPIIHIRTKGKRNPETAIREAADKIRARNNVFKKSFEKALREWQEK